MQLEKDEFRLWEMAAAFACASQPPNTAIATADAMVEAFRQRKVKATGHPGPPAAPAAAKPADSFRASPLPGQPPGKPRTVIRTSVAELSLNEKLALQERLQAKFSGNPAGVTAEDMQDMATLNADETLQRIAKRPSA